MHYPTPTPAAPGEGRQRKPHGKHPGSSLGSLFLGLPGRGCWMMGRCASLWLLWWHRGPPSGPRARCLREGPYVPTNLGFPPCVGLLRWALSGGGRVLLWGCWDDAYRVLALLVRSGFPVPWILGGGLRVTPTHTFGTARSQPSRQTGSARLIERFKNRKAWKRLFT